MSGRGKSRGGRVSVVKKGGRGRGRGAAGAGGNARRVVRANPKSQSQPATLSGLFAQLEKKNAAPSVRQQGAQNLQKNRRQAILEAKRKGGNAQQAAKQVTNKKAPAGRGAGRGRGRGRGAAGRGRGAAGQKTGVVVAKKNAKNTKKPQAKGAKGGRGGGRGAAAGRGAGTKAGKAGAKAGTKAKKDSKGKGKGKTKEEQVDTENLMDTYWHAGGKGPDPKIMEVDRTMDSYWSSKPSAAATEAEPAAAAEAAPEVADTDM